MLNQTLILDLSNVWFTSNMKNWYKKSISFVGNITGLLNKTMNTTRNNEKVLWTFGFNSKNLINYKTTPDIVLVGLYLRMSLSGWRNDLGKKRLHHDDVWKRKTGKETTTPKLVECILGLTVGHEFLNSEGKRVTIGDPSSQRTRGTIFGQGNSLFGFVLFEYFSFYQIENSYHDFK